jgi:hypothetical protein
LQLAGSNVGIIYPIKAMDRLVYSLMPLPPQWKAARIWLLRVSFLDFLVSVDGQQRS